MRVVKRYNNSCDFSLLDKKHQALSTERCESLPPHFPIVKPKPSPVWGSWKPGKMAEETFSDALSEQQCKWVELHGRQLCTASLSKRVTYVTQMNNSTLLKPNDIEYVLYSTGKLYKWSSLNTRMVFLHLDTKYFINYVYFGKNESLTLIWVV